MVSAKFAIGAGLTAAGAAGELNTLSGFVGNNWFWPTPNIDPQVAYINYLWFLIWAIPLIIGLWLMLG